MGTNPADDFSAHISDLAGIIRKARKHRFGVGSHRTYAPRARGALAGIRKSFVLLQRNFPPERYPRVAFQLSSIEPLVTKLVEVFPSDIGAMKRLLDEIAFKVQSDLAAELELPESKPLSSAIDFLPDDIVETKHHVPKKILWEANRCYDAACYNACAAMLRRLIEVLIIGAFEHHSLGNKIKKDGEYLEFGALIGKAAAEPALKLGRETKRVLPDLKYFGDVGAHSRMIVVRKQDLDRLHNQVRGAVEELARNL